MDFIVPSLKAVKTDKIGLIDADYIKYHVISDLNGIHSEKQLRLSLEETIGRLQSLIEAPMLFLFSGSNYWNYRTNIAFDKAYKGTRKKSGSELDLIPIKTRIVDYVKLRYPSLIFKELEADDLCSMLQDEDTFIYSEDKDLKQVAGTHWDIKKSQFYEISEEEAFRFLMTQMLEGDTVDNIPGLKGCGTIGSYNLLTNIDDKHLAFKVLEEYIKVNGTLNGIDRFVENWNLLKLRVNRGAHFKEKYKLAFNTLKLLKS